MKKFLVLCVSAAMLLSTAAASLAAATVAGDFRYDMYQDESSASGDESYGVSDLRVRVSGDISQSVSATANFKLVHTSKGVQGATEALNTDEFFFTHKQAWGSIKAGYYEYKFTPSRVLLKSGQCHVWSKADVLVAATVNTPVEGLTADVMVQPYKQNDADDGAYGLSVAYKAENWGAKATYADYKWDKDLTAIDVYYMINDDMKVFVDAVDYSENDKAKTRYSKIEKGIETGKGIDGIDPVIGFSWDKIAGTKLFGAVEYAINKRFEDTNNEYSEYTVNLKYKLDNNVGLEFEHYVVGDSKTKDMFRVRYQF